MTRHVFCNSDFDVDEDIDSIIDHHAKRKAWRESPRGMKALEYGERYREWQELVNRVKRRPHYDNSEDMQDPRSELGVMSWWTTYSGDPDDLAIIRWRFRREE